jgi:hypothetical protein
VIVLLPLRSVFNAKDGEIEKRCRLRQRNQQFIKVELSLQQEIMTDMGKPYRNGLCLENRKAGSTLNDSLLLE